jgi:hypothetical protein
MSDKGFSGRTASDVAREMLSQPALFLEFDGMDGFTPPPNAVVRYTGERQEEEMMLKVGAMRLLGASDRQIEQACHVTRRSILPILAMLEKTGRITPLKERLAQMCGDNAERSSIVLRLLLEQVEQDLTAPEDEEEEEDDEPSADEPSGVLALMGETPGNAPKKRKAKRKRVTMEMAAMIKAVSTANGVTTEKTLLLTGQATEIVETRVRAGREEFEQWWTSEVKPIEATVSAVDSGSASPAAISELMNVLPAPGHEPDTSAPPDQGQTLTDPPQPKPTTEPRETGGGGGGAAAGAEEPPTG